MSPPSASIPHLEIDRVPLVRWLWGCTFAFAAASLAGQYARHFLGHGNLLGLVPFFDLNGESSLPTFFSILLLLGATAILTAVAINERSRQTPHSRDWRWLATGFLCLVMDEQAALHDHLGEVVRAFRPTHGLFHFSWVVPGIVAVLVVVAVFRRFRADLPPATQRRFTLAGVIYVGGAVGVEMLGGLYAESHGENFHYQLFGSVEELMEISGVILFIDALLRYAAAHRIALSLGATDRHAAKLD